MVTDHRLWLSGHSALYSPCEDHHHHSVDSNPKSTC